MSRGINTGGGRLVALMSTAVMAVALVFASTASADFGIKSFDGAVTAAPAPNPAPNPGDLTDPANYAPPFTTAGGHPYAASTSFEVNTAMNSFGNEGPDGGGFKNAIVEIPPGVIGNPTAMPTCSSASKIPAVAEVLTEPDPNALCSPSTIVGNASIKFTAGGGVETDAAPVYNLDPPPGVPAQFGFNYLSGVVRLNARLRSDGDYGISVEARNISQAAAVIGSSVTLWGVPADPSHDSQRCAAFFLPLEFNPNPFCLFEPNTPGGPNPANIPARAFLTNPTACTPPGVGLETRLHIDPWDPALSSDDASFVSHAPPGLQPPQFMPEVADWGPELGAEGCDEVPFSPTVEMHPSESGADSASGLAVDLSVPTDGLENPTGLAQSALKKAVVTLPEGMTVNPSSASGLGSCSESDLADETASSAPGEGCPLDSKIGSVRVDTPLLDEPVGGSIFLAQQGANQFGSLLALYIVVKSFERGVVIKLPGRVDPDPATGQLVATFDDNPQLPFSNLHVEFKTGSRAPLITPRLCGTHEIETDLYPWARPDDPVHSESSFNITSGPGGTPCPTPGQFDPAFEAGTTTPIAGAYSPLIVNASRPDGSEVLKGLNLTLPEGLTGKLAGIPACPEAALGAAAARSGAEELTSPSCPAESKVGTVDVAAGAGTTPFHVSAGAYLAGPYKGAPLSLAVITPALAGPFDLGTVVTRAAAQIDPVTTQIKVTSDPIPTILQGIPLKVRSISVDTARPQFTLNPTDCDPMSLEGTLIGASSSKALSNRFQVGACKALDFAPRLSLALKGAVHRRAHPSLRATLTAKPGEANIARAQVRLPRAAFLDNAHIGTVCTRPDFAAHACPSGSVYGKVSATTPILDYALKGRVYLRANPAHKLPDLVAELRGPDTQPIEIELAGKTDSVKGALRNTFEAVPDAPVKKFSLTLFGGKKGLIEMSSGFCKSPRGSVRLDAQSGAAHDTRPVVRARCGG